MHVSHLILILLSYIKALPLKSDIILCDKILLYFAYAFIFTLTPVCYTIALTFSPCFYSQSASQQEAQKV